MDSQVNMQASYPQKSDVIPNGLDGGLLKQRQYESRLTVNCSALTKKKLFGGFHVSRKNCKSFSTFFATPLKSE